MSTEEWRPISGFPDYEVSNLGRVRSFKSGSPRVLRQCSANASRPDLYQRVSIYANSRQRTAEVHVLVAEAFHGPRPRGLQVRHLDGNSLNNAAENPAYGTCSENHLDQLRHGTHHLATRDHCFAGHEYTEETVRWSRRKRNGRPRRVCLICARERDRRRDRSDRYTQASA